MVSCPPKLKAFFEEFVHGNLYGTSSNPPCYRLCKRQMIFNVRLPVAYIMISYIISFIDITNTKIFSSLFSSNILSYDKHSLFTLLLLQNIRITKKVQLKQPEKSFIESRVNGQFQFCLRRSFL